MNAERTKAFDKFASNHTADQCEDMMDAVLNVLKTERGLKPSRREELLEELSGWVRHYRIKTYNFRQGV